MKKKLVSVLLCAAMMSTLLAGCGNGGEAAPAGDAAADTTADTAGGGIPGRRQPLATVPYIC